MPLTRFPTTNYYVERQHTDEICRLKNAEQNRSGKIFPALVFIFGKFEAQGFSLIK